MPPVDQCVLLTLGLLVTGFAARALIGLDFSVGGGAETLDRIGTDYGSKHKLMCVCASQFGSRLTDAAADCPAPTAPQLPAVLFVAVVLEDGEHGCRGGPGQRRDTT